ncbi:response regulator transcription factor [Myroides fluvii]|uniref:response regulator transcription factor n=1 Tax=Myroides fluvii TaxID=2572594 RepID=UPI00131D70B1|nr:helix-turn-helix transcriptional regulator [Myroides fluvii]
MQDKFTQKNIISGLLPTDNNIEIFGDNTARKAYFIQNGKIRLIDQLPKELRTKLYAMFLNDPIAWSDLGKLSFSEALNEYAFCIYGGLNNTPDIVEGEFGPAEGFRCSKNCKCARWPSKQLKLDYGFTPREKEVFMLLAEGLEDKVIAEQLFIAPSTVGTHKMSVFRKLKVKSKREVMKLKAHF